VRNVAVKTYLRKGKEKSAITWDYEAADGTPRHGVVLVFQSQEDLEVNFDDLAGLAIAEKKNGGASKNGAPASPLVAKRSSMTRVRSGNNLAEDCGPKTVMHVLVLEKPAQDVVGSPVRQRGAPFASAVSDEKTTCSTYQKILSTKAAFLRASAVVEVSVMLPSASADNSYMSIFNFTAEAAYNEVKIHRHILPVTARVLELGRLSHFDVEPCFFPDAPSAHVYVASGKQSVDCRLFVRSRRATAPHLAAPTHPSVVSAISRRYLRVGAHSGQPARVAHREGVVCAAEPDPRAHSRVQHARAGARYARDTREIRAREPPTRRQIWMALIARCPHRRLVIRAIASA